MKSLIQLIILSAILCPLIGMAIACSEEEDCSLNARPMMQCYLYTLDPKDLTIVKDTLDSLTITAYGTDSIILNNQKKVHSLSLPLRYAEDSTRLILRYSRTLTDTLVIHHSNTPYFLSMDCGYQMKQSITSVRHTCRALDSIYISNKEAGIYGVENLKLFY